MTARGPNGATSLQRLLKKDDYYYLAKTCGVVTTPQVSLSKNCHEIF